MVKFDELPVEIQEKILNEQEKQGNRRDPESFDRDKNDGGFDWIDAEGGHDFWDTIINDEDFDGFFQKYPKKEEKTFPRMMLVRDAEHNSWQEEEVHGYIPTLKFPWIVKESDDLNYTMGYVFAKEVDEAPRFVYLSLQDISEGKGVGVNPKLIKIKE